MISKDHYSPRAFTAVEALVASALLAMVALTVGGALAAGRQQSQNSQDMLRASMLARALLDEVLRVPYSTTKSTLGPDPGQVFRYQFDDLQDYANYTDGPTNVSFISVDSVGSPASTLYDPEFQNFSRTITMTPTALPGPASAPNINGLLVTITVSKNAQTLCTLERFVCP